MKFSKKDYTHKKLKPKDGQTLVALQKTNKNEKVLASHGVAKQLFSIPDFILEDRATTFVSELEGLKPKTVTKKKQIEDTLKVINNPLSAPYVFCISGNPNDLKAKLLATYILEKAIYQFIDKEKLDEKTQKTLKHKSAPVFHNVMGWSKNPLLENQVSPCLLVLSNVPKGMTQYKQEKLRDILERYSDIPRIVVTAGHDPLTFFNGSLFMGINYACYLTDGIVKKAHEI